MSREAELEEALRRLVAAVQKRMQVDDPPEPQLVIELLDAHRSAGELLERIDKQRSA